MRYVSAKFNQVDAPAATPCCRTRPKTPTEGRRLDLEMRDEPRRQVLREREEEQDLAEVLRIRHFHGLDLSPSRQRSILERLRFPTGPPEVEIRAAPCRRRPTLERLRFPTGTPEVRWENPVLPPGRLRPRLERLRFPTGPGLRLPFCQLRGPFLGQPDPGLAGRFSCSLLFSRGRPGPLSS